MLRSGRECCDKRVEEGYGGFEIVTANGARQIVDGLWIEAAAQGLGQVFEDLNGAGVVVPEQFAQ
ncbi:MAG: hypothetical protein LDL29_09905, partial [Dechloromonas sp.]|nr:hypothetical protein [Dechloromonas sp.]